MAAGTHIPLRRIRARALGRPLRRLPRAPQPLDGEPRRGLLQCVGRRRHRARRRHLPRGRRAEHAVRRRSGSSASSTSTTWSASGPSSSRCSCGSGCGTADAYRELRTWLLLSIAIASLSYLLLPTAPPRLVEGLGIADTVGLAGHDTGSFAGIKFNPYAAMPSMHVGWSLLIGLIGFRVARRPAVQGALRGAPGDHGDHGDRDRQPLLPRLDRRHPRRSLGGRAAQAPAAPAGKPPPAARVGTTAPCSSH